jgi:hypothetical protein
MCLAAARPLDFARLIAPASIVLGELRTVIGFIAYTILTADPKAAALRSGA